MWSCSEFWWDFETQQVCFQKTTTLVILSVRDGWKASMRPSGVQKDLFPLNLWLELADLSHVSTHAFLICPYATQVEHEESELSVWWCLREMSVGSFSLFFARWWADAKESSRAGVADSPLAEMKNIIQDESLCWDGKRLTPFTVLWNWQEASETAEKASFWLRSFLSLARH